jgi:hypothetical protein
MMAMQMFICCHSHVFLPFRIALICLRSIVELELEQPSSLRLQSCLTQLHERHTVMAEMVPVQRELTRLIKQRLTQDGLRCKSLTIFSRQPSSALLTVTFVHTRFTLLRLSLREDDDDNSSSKQANSAMKMLDHHLACHRSLFCCFTMTTMNKEANPRRPAPIHGPIGRQSHPSLCSFCLALGTAFARVRLDGFHWASLAVAESSGTHPRRNIERRSESWVPKGAVKAVDQNWTASMFSNGNESASFLPW